MGRRFDPDRAHLELHYLMLLSKNLVHGFIAEFCLGIYTMSNECSG